MSWYVIDYTLWPTVDSDTHERHTDRSTHESDTRVGAINAVLYYVRGRKSDYEMARINEVIGPFETEQEARDVQYES